MNHPALLCFALATIAGAATARADQCAYNDKAVAERAAALVKKGATVLAFCEPCGDVLAHKQPFVVRSVSIDPSRNALVVNSELQDLAYLFVQTTRGTFKNVGIATQCGASDVSVAIENGKPIGRAKSTHQARPRPPMPPPPPRAQSIDELAGEWSVRIQTRFSTCSGIKAGSTTTWRVQVTNGTAEVKADDGLELSGVQDPSTKIVKTQLAPAKLRSSLVVELTLLSKDRFFGQLVRAERQPQRRDPICIVHQQVSGTRKP